jgi:hypothetical protein
MIIDGTNGLTFNDSSTQTKGGLVAGGTIATGTIIALSTSGITFPATQSASADANTLDDYEEGTWTATPNANLTVSNNVGRYTKVGNIVTCSAWMGVSSVSGSNTVEFALPFTNATSPTSGVNITICPTATYSVATGDAGLIGYVDANYAGLVFLKINSSAAWAGLTNSGLTTSSTFAFNITYKTA